MAFDPRLRMKIQAKKVKRTKSKKYPMIRRKHLVLVWINPNPPRR